jgi:hypothetical protein
VSEEFLDSFAIIPSSSRPLLKLFISSKIQKPRRIRDPEILHQSILIGWKIERKWQKWCNSHSRIFHHQNLRKINKKLYYS